MSAHTRSEVLGRKTTSMTANESLSKPVRPIYLHILLLEMRIVIQKVKRASVTVDSEIVSS